MDGKVENKTPPFPVEGNKGKTIPFLGRGLLDTGPSLHVCALPVPGRDPGLPRSSPGRPCPQELQPPGLLTHCRRDLYCDRRNRYPTVPRKRRPSSRPDLGCPSQGILPDVTVVWLRSRNPLGIRMDVLEPSVKGETQSQRSRHLFRYHGRRGSARTFGTGRDPWTRLRFDFRSYLCTHKGISRPL